MQAAPAITPGRNPADEADPEKFYTWTVELSVSATWVADGFDFEDDDAVAALLLEGRLSHCRSDEVRGRVIKAPPEAEIAYEQGENVPDIEAMKVLVNLSEPMRERLVGHGQGTTSICGGRVDTSLARRKLTDNMNRPTDLGWRVLAYLGVKPARVRHERKSRA